MKLQKMKEGEPKEPTIIEILNGELKKGSNDANDYPTVETIAGRMGIDAHTLQHWLESDKRFQQGLFAVKQAFDSDPLKDTPDDEIKLDAVTLSFGITVILEETKKDIQF
ncbi:MAG TPA: hypothetical protein VGA72_09530 [Anaerolineales bacterium]